MTLWEIAVLVDLDAELTSGEEDHAKAIKEALNGR